MRIVFLFLLLLSINILFAQKTETVYVPTVDTAGNKVDVEASVDAQQWVAHLTKNLQSSIKKAARNGMRAGTYIVQVRFLVERDGSISDAQALNDPGYGLGRAAVKALQGGPKWNAGEVNGRKVRSYHTQPITFVIQEQ